jgi:hypothetical protein
LKEVAHYKNELQTNEMKVDEIKRDASKDKYDVKRFEDILNESYNMVPDSTKRLQAAMEDLSSYLTNNNTALDPLGPWYQTAKLLLQDNQNSTTETQSSSTPISISHAIETRLDDLVDGEAF